MLALAEVNIESLLCWTTVFASQSRYIYSNPAKTFSPGSWGSLIWSSALLHLLFPSSRSYSIEAKFLLFSNIQTSRINQSVYWEHEQYNHTKIIISSHQEDYCIKFHIPLYYYFFLISISKKVTYVWQSSTHHCSQKKIISSKRLSSNLANEINSQFCTKNNDLVRGLAFPLGFRMGKEGTYTKASFFPVPLHCKC